MKLTTLLSAATMLTLSCLVSKDIKSNWENRNTRLNLRVVPVLWTGLLLLAGFLISAPLQMGELLLGLAAGISLLLMYPSSCEKPDASLKKVAVVILADALLLLSGTVFLKSPGTGLIVCRMNVMLILLAAFCFRSSISRMAGLKGLFKNASVWHNLEEFSRLFFLMFFLVVCFLAFSSVSFQGGAAEAFSYLSMVLMLGLYVAAYCRAFSGRTLILSKSKEDKVKDIIKGNLRTVCVEKLNEDAKMDALYKRVMDFMTQDKPYLDEAFDMADMAEKLYTNKLYLSRTINVLSGRNFRQFVNYHRVNYAMELIKKDPRLKISEVSEMSGFHSVVSFNMAFKINMGTTPSDWMRDYLASQEFLRGKKRE